MSALVEFHHVTKVYRRGRNRLNVRNALPGRVGRSVKGELHTALSGISLAVGEGRSLGVIGPNGAGKSTLLKLVAKVIAPTNGRVIVRGRTAALIELGAGLHPEMTGRENIEFTAAVLGMGRRQLRARLGEIIDFSAVGEYLNTPVKRYSSGMLARLGFAVASHLDADVLVIDEVLSVGDASFQRRCYDRIAARRDEGAAILYVTHQLWTVPLLCDSALLLRRGEQVIVGNPQKVLERYMAGDERAVDNHFRGDLVRRVALDRPSIAPGEPLTLDVDLDLPHPLPDGRLLISFVGNLTTTQGSVASDEAGIDLGSGTRHAIRCTFMAVPLAPGDYELYVSLFADRSTPVVDDHRRVTISIEGAPVDVATRGLVALTARWAATSE